MLAVKLAETKHLAVYYLLPQKSETSFLARRDYPFASFRLSYGLRSRNASFKKSGRNGKYSTHYYCPAITPYLLDIWLTGTPNSGTVPTTKRHPTSMEKTLRSNLKYRLTHMAILSIHYCKTYSPSQTYILHICFEFQVQGTNSVTLVQIRQRRCTRQLRDC